MRFLIVASLSLFLLGCTQSPQVSQNVNTAAVPQRSEKLETVTAHTTENLNPPMRNANSAAAAPGGKSKWTQSGTPIDTSKFDAAIAKAEKDLKGGPAVPTARAELAEAYYQRAFALTQAQQYAAAIGDYRRVLAYDPDHADAKQWVGQIIQIYESINREYPKEGEEPPPLPFKAQ